MKWILLAVSIAVLAGVIAYSDPFETAAYMAKADMTLVAAALAVSAITMALRVVKWQVLLGKVPFSALAPIQVFGMTLSNFTPGKIGEPAKALLLKLRLGRPVSSTLVTIIWERIFDVVMLIGLSIAALFLFGLTEFFVIGIIAMSGFSLLIVFLVVVIKNRRIGLWAFSIAKKLPVLNRISSGFVNSFYRVRIRRESLMASLLITAVIWVVEGVILYLTFLSVGISSDPLLLASLIALAELIAIASFLPGGIGAFEVVMLVLLAAFSIDGAAATAGLFLYRFVTFWFGAFVGAGCFVYLSRIVDISDILKRSEK